MIDVRKAVKIAQLFVGEMYAEAKDIRLEEVEYSPPDDEWDVVVSFPLEDDGRSFVNMLNGNRLFKKVVVNATTGEPMGLKVFKV